MSASERQRPAAASRAVAERRPRLFHDLLASAHGYIGNHTRGNPNEPVERDSGAHAHIKLRQYRDRENLSLPIGPAAATLGLRPAPTPNTPPPQRPVSASHRHQRVPHAGTAARGMTPWAAMRVSVAVSADRGYTERP